MKNANINLLEIKNFVKEQEKFHMIFKILQSNEDIVYTDYENYIMARSAVGYPLWIWTIDNISEEKINEVLMLMEKYFDLGELKITCKEELYVKIKEIYEVSAYFEMGFLRCKKLNSVNKARGFLDKPSYSDKITLANFWINLCKEENNIDIQFNDALIEVDEWLKSNNFYVLRNPMGKVVSLASYSVLEGHARISHVYTPPEERKKGYCKNLVYEITKEILDLNLVPLLYTNYNHKISNELYKKIGYEEEGYLVSFLIKK